MKFTETYISGIYEIEPQRIGDERGYFARAWCEREFETHGLQSRMVQGNMSQNRYRGLIRGLHYQIAPYKEAKLVQCTKGTIFDVAVDLRTDSPTFLKWVGVELSSEKRNMLYIPEGCAHAYQVLEDETEVYYLVSEFYSPDAERGARWNDPCFGIDWPISENPIVSQKDASWPDYVPNQP